MGVRREDWVLKKLSGSSIKTKGNSTLLDPAPEMASQYMPYRRLEVRNSLQRFKLKLHTKHHQRGVVNTSGTAESTATSAHCVDTLSTHYRKATFL